MASGTHHARSGSLRRIPGQAGVVDKGPLHRHSTTTFERLLLMAAIVFLPLQSYLPALAGFSSLYILFAVIAGYTFLNQPTALKRVWLHPVFVAAYMLLAVAFLIELSHPYAKPTEVFRTGQMIAAAIFVAVLCRDKRALQWGIYGYLIAGVGISVFLFLTTYGALQGVMATDFQEASQIRQKVISDAAFRTLEANANLLGIIAAQGVVVALALALAAKSSRRRAICFTLAGFCLVGTFLPMSRSGIAVAIISSTIVMFAYGVRMKVIAIAAVLGAAVLIWVPQAAFARLTFSTESVGGRTEARARIYTAAVEYLPEYGMTGVGLGNFYESWGKQTPFAKKYGDEIKVLGPHNWFVAVTVYWGLTALLALMTLLYQAYRCVPKRCGADVRSLCLLGLAVSLFLTMLVSHRLSGKEFSLGLGLLVGVRSWIWPAGIVSLASLQPWSFNAISTFMKPGKSSASHASTPHPRARFSRGRPPGCG